MAETQEAKRKNAVEAEIIRVPSGPRAVMVGAAQLRRQMARDQEIRKVINEYIKNNMVEGKDYGSIEVKKGTGIMSKPSLFKPGGEKFCSLFKIRPTFKKDTETVEMLGNTPGIIAYICELVDTSGNVIGEGRGTAKADPKLSADFDINKQVKIAEKRAQIDAVLRTGGLSDFFTQDMEDMPKEAKQVSEARPASVKQKNLIAKLFLERGANTPNLLLASIGANGIVNPKEMTTTEASELIEKLFANNVEVVTAQDRNINDDDFPCGDGDPDFYGYPGEDEMTDESIAAGLEEAERSLLEES